MTTIGKLWTGAVAYVSLLVGAGLSVAGNLADTYRTRGADVDNLDKVMAAGWPILVLLAVHMFVSPHWSPKPMFQAWRWAGVGGVGGMAMVVSWVHLHDLMVSRGQLPIVSILGPLSIDGMAIMATGLILSTRVRGHVASRWEMTADTVKAAATDMCAWAHEYMTGQKPIVDMDTMATGQRLSADTDAAAGYSRWADLLDGAADMATVKADADKLNGLATWASWTPADDSAVAAMTADTPDVHFMSGLTRERPDALPRRTRTSAGQSYPAELAGYVQEWDPSRVTRAELVQLLAGYFEVSTRTVRRWLAAYTGQPVYGPPEGE